MHGKAWRCILLSCFHKAIAHWWRCWSTHLTAHALLFSERLEAKTENLIHTDIRLRFLRYLYASPNRYRFKCSHFNYRSKTWASLKWSFKCKIWLSELQLTDEKSLQGSFDGSLHLVFDFVQKAVLPPFYVSPVSCTFLPYWRLIYLVSHLTTSIARTYMPAWLILAGRKNRQRSCIYVTFLPFRSETWKKEQHRQATFTNWQLFWSEQEQIHALVYVTKGHLSNGKKHQAICCDPRQYENRCDGSSGYVTQKMK